MTFDELMAPDSVRAQLRRSGVPDQISAHILDGTALDDSASLRAALDWVTGPLLTLVLGGAVGSGKTLAACWTITQHHGRRNPYMHELGDMPPTWYWKGATFVPLVDFQNRSLFDDEDADFRHRVAATSLLILDDVGSERGDGAGAVQSLISTRMAERRRTVLTTNLTGEAFKARFGARVVDRIRERGTFVNTGAQSLRKSSVAT